MKVKKVVLVQGGIWAAALIYPLTFGWTMTRIDHSKSVFFNAQCLEIYVLLIAILETIWLCRQDPKVESGAPYSYIKKFGIGFPVSFFVIALGVIVGFLVFWGGLLI